LSFVVFLDYSCFSVLTKRIIPCLDVKNGMTVKGVQFENIRHAGDPVELGALYAERGADELVFLDITATLEGRSTFQNVVSSVARAIDIPFTVGGGIRSVSDVARLLHAGADKVSVNSAAVHNPALLTQLSHEFGAQCIVAALDVRQYHDSPSGWRIVINAGTQPTEFDALWWAQEVERLGAGEILLTSMDHDGMKQGFALEITRTIADAVNIPVIASGGAGTCEHFRDVFITGHASAGLAASLFHFRELDIPDLKLYLTHQGVPIRLT
jgi:imidazole glycerol-phosphate synthase subunit HisF